MTNFPFKMSADFAVTADCQQKVEALVDKMAALDAGTNGQTAFTSGFDANKTALSLALESATEDAQQKALLVYGPVLTELAQMATRKKLDCSDNAPTALRALLVPMEASFIAIS